MGAHRIRIPRVERGMYATDLAASVKQRLVALLASAQSPDGLRPVPATTACEPAIVWLSTEQEQAVAALAQRSPGCDSLPAFIAAWLTQANRPVDTREHTTHAASPDTQSALATPLDIANRALGTSTRPDQAMFFRQISSELRRADRHAGAVIFAEGSTGIGKTRAFLVATLEWMDTHPRGNVVVALPTYAVMLQTIAEWTALTEHDGQTRAWRALCGQREFVSAERLREAIEQHPDAQGTLAAQQWLAAHGPAAKDDPFGHRWMARSLEIACQGEWPYVDDILLDSDAEPEDMGMVAYLAQFMDHDIAQVTFVTHAMLAVEIRLRTSAARRAQRANPSEPQPAGGDAFAAWLATDASERRSFSATMNDALSEYDDGGARLPDIHLLVVDEAHLLESAFASAFARGYAVSSLRRALDALRDADPKAVLVADIHALDAVWTRLRDLGEGAGREGIDVSASPVALAAVRQIHAIVERISKRWRKSRSPTPAYRQIRAIRAALDIAEFTAPDGGHRFGTSATLTFSPVDGWPSVDVGRHNLTRELDYLWHVAVQNASLLVSATLYESMPMLNVDNVRALLGVRHEHVRMIDPVRPGWLYRPVCLHVPSDTVHADGVRRWWRPSAGEKLTTSEREDRLARWRNDIVDYVALAYASAAGGVLVLLTSHHDRAEIVAALTTTGQIAAADLLTQAPGIGIDVLRERFLAQSRAGRKPILIGVGGCWTGLDLSDGTIPADRDNTLTDLIVPLAPFGATRSLTHAWRKRKFGMAVEIAAMLAMFRQGLGRLVRRDGLPSNRRIHFLDARMHVTAMAPMFQPIIRAMVPYTRRVEV